MPAKLVSVQTDSPLGEDLQAVAPEVFNRHRRVALRKPGLPVTGRRFGELLSVVCLLFVTSVASGQSAQDIATARRTASEGIRRFQEKNYAEALNLLERAQALYDAPVHLLYIARAQVELGRWVEGAETYRKLVRAKVSDDAPKAFHEAVEAGNTELSALVTKIPTLRIVLVPEGTKARITLNGEELPEAAVGIDRTTDPGEYEVVVSSETGTEEKRAVKLAAGAKEEVSFDLRAPTGAGPAPIMPEPGAAAPATSQPPDERIGATSKSEMVPMTSGFMVGLRLGVSGLSGGMGITLPRGDQLKASGVATTGGGIELRGGYKFSRHLMAVAYLEAHSLNRGKELRRLNSGGSDDDGTAGMGLFGLGIVLGGDPRKVGPFGELDISLVRNLSFEQKIGGSSCNTNSTFSGSGARLGGGLYIPTRYVGTLTPMLMLNVGSFESYQAESNCPATLVPFRLMLDRETKIENPEQNLLVFFGIGSEFYLGAK